MTHISLQEAIVEDDLELVIKMIGKNPMCVDEVGEDACHPSFVAAEHGRFQILEYLMSYTRVSQNIYDLHHNSILHYAARSNHLDLFAYLVERISMNPFEVNTQLETPLDIALRYESEHIIAYYKDRYKVDPVDVYKNPIVTGTFPDPSIVRVGEDYYMVHSSFIYFPCIPILHSFDLIHWEIIGHAITDTSYIDMTDIGGGRGFWAPDISYHNGRFYVTATYRLNDGGKVLRRQMVVHASVAKGPYSQPTFIDEDGIDPSLFTGLDGKRYMLLNRGARIFEVNEDASKQLSQARMLWYGDNKRAPEAPHLLVKDGYYYCFVAEGGTGRHHQISVARSKTLMGIYEPCPHNPILIQRDLEHPIQRSGHGKLVQTQYGEWFIVYLCSRMIDQKYSILGRETALDKVTWTTDGWPLVNMGDGPSGAAIKPKLIEHKFNYRNIRSFSRSQLDPSWHFVRKRSDDFIDIDAHKAQVTLIPGSDDLNQLSCRNIMVKRQKKFLCETSVKLILTGLESHDEIGLTCYYDENTYLKYFVTGQNGFYCIRVIEHIGDDEHQSFEVITDVASDKEIDLELMIFSHYLKRSFSYKFQGDNVCKIGKLDRVTYLCDEGLKGAKRFTGAMIGLFALDRTGSNNKKAVFEAFILERNNHDT